METMNDRPDPKFAIGERVKYVPTHKQHPDVVAFVVHREFSRSFLSGTVSGRTGFYVGWLYQTNLTPKNSYEAETALLPFPPSADQEKTNWDECPWRPSKVKQPELVG